MLSTLLVITVVLSIIGLSGCASNNNDIEQELDYELKVSESETEEQTEVKPVDPLAIYELESGRGLCLFRNEKLYRLYGEISVDKKKEYQMGYMDYHIDGNSASVYFNPQKSDYNYYISFGGFPLIEIESFDSIRGYGKTKINLQKAEFISYALTIDESLSIFSECPIVEIYYNDADAIETHCVKVEKDNISIKDKSGNLIADYYDLPYNEQYVASWYEGTTYKELTLTANNPCYKIKGDIVNSIEGTLTKNGYATFDFSNVSPGLYYVEVEDLSGRNGLPGTFIKVN